MYTHLKYHKRLWRLIGGLSVLTALISLLRLDIYEKVSSDLLMPGTVSQDLQTLVVGIVLMILSMNMREERVGRQVISTGLVGYIAYAYAIYAFEQYYTVLYFLYLVLLMLSAFELLLSVRTFKNDAVDTSVLSPLIVRWNSFLMILTPMIFITLWALQLMPLIGSGDRIECFYSIYVLDLALIMPAMIFAAIILIRGFGEGILLSTMLLILGAAMLLPVGLGELIRPLYGQAANMGALAMFTILSCVYLGTAIMTIRQFRSAGRGIRNEEAS